MRRSALCGLGLGLLSALTLTIYIYIMCAVVFLPVEDYTPIACGAELLMGVGFGLLFAFLFVRFSRPHAGVAFCLWCLSALLFSQLLVPAPDHIFFAMSGYEYHMGGGGGFAFFFALLGFFALYFLSLLIGCVSLWDKIPPYSPGEKRE